MKRIVIFLALLMTAGILAAQPQLLLSSSLKGGDPDADDNPISLDRNYSMVIKSDTPQATATAIEKYIASLPFVITRSDEELRAYNVTLSTIQKDAADEIAEIDKLVDYINGILGNKEELNSLKAKAKSRGGKMSDILNEINGYDDIHTWCREIEKAIKSGATKGDLTDILAICNNKRLWCEVMQNYAVSYANIEMSKYAIPMCVPMWKQKGLMGVFMLRPPFQITADVKVSINEDNNVVVTLSRFESFVWTTTNDKGAMVPIEGAKSREDNLIILEGCILTLGEKNALVQGPEYWKARGITMDVDANTVKMVLEMNIGERMAIYSEAEKTGHTKVVNALNLNEFNSIDAYKAAKGYGGTAKTLAKSWSDCALHYSQNKYLPGVFMINWKEFIEDKYNEVFGMIYKNVGGTFVEITANGTPVYINENGKIVPVNKATKSKWEAEKKTSLF